MKTLKMLINNKEIIFFRLLESTRSLISFEGDQQEASDQLSLENQAISTAINTFGLKKQSFDLFDDSASDDSDQPSTSAQSSSSRMPRSSSSSMTLESEAINSAISTFGLHKSGA